MIIQIKCVSVQVIAHSCVIDEISINFLNKHGDVIATFPKKPVDKVIDFGKVLYVRIES